MDHHHEQHISNLLEKIRKTSDFKPSYHQSKKIGESSSTASCNDQEDAMDWLDSREKNQTWNRYQEHLKESFRAEEERQKLHNSSITCIQGDQSLDLKLKTQLLENMQKSKYQKMLEFRKKLPSYNMRREIVKLIEGNQSVAVESQS
ncbi:ATP-dependent RNA helicase DHX36-like [Limulus polyphemus]|uniref:ATP-dependent RNA helicase DHX36-like n=1 Tax=Limulus polyphemus TaxID=6850 RepID=A0ABM1T718_LIMPO|nr:ATP-dependent RNA helicase DHX36-like [Limulus polyphemus]